MKPVFEVEEVPGVLDTSKPVPDWVKSDSTPRTGIVKAEARLTAHQLRNTRIDEAKSALYEITDDLGRALIERIGDGRSYVVAFSGTASNHDSNPDNFFRQNCAVLSAQVTILLRHWQDAQIGEDVVADGIVQDGSDLAERIVRHSDSDTSMGDYGTTPVPYRITVDFDRWTFQRITAEGRTLCWRRMA